MALPFVPHAPSTYPQPVSTRYTLFDPSNSVASTESGIATTVSPTLTDSTTHVTPTIRETSIGVGLSKIQESAAFEIVSRSPSSCHLVVVTKLSKNRSSSTCTSAGSQPASLMNASDTDTTSPSNCNVAPNSLQAATPWT